MCGIAGIIGRIGDPNRLALKRMNAAMTHRGPDGEGTWESAPDRAGWGTLLAHRRLSILDLSTAASQPMVDPATGDVVVFNGEIYNFASLRREMEAAGQRFQSTGDTAVMLRTLALGGREAVSHLRGMFAFAFWDASSQELLLARDPLGMKPLYVARNPSRGDWALAFASEVRTLLASGLLGKPRLDPAATASVVWNGFVAGPGTAVAGVESLWPGQWKAFDRAGVETGSRRYWAVPDAAQCVPQDEAGVASALEEGLRLHLASDVPLAVFLSSGVDSSAVANLAQKAGQGAVHTFTLAFEDAQLNEGVPARRIAQAIGTVHQEVVLTEGDFIDGLDGAIDSLDQPTFDGLNSYYMARAIRRAGFVVALVGTGGDELFGGYTSFRDLPTLARWSRRFRAVPRSWLVAMSKRIATWKQPSAGNVAPQTRWAKLPAMVDRGDDLVALYQLAYALFLPDFQEQLLAEPDRHGLRDGLAVDMRKSLDREIHGRSSLSAISVLETRLFLAERLLRDNDAASMAASIEQRLPLVDQVLFEAVSGLPDSLRYDPVGRKAFLRRVGLRGLDPGLFDRPKTGFVLPFDRWIRSRLGKVMDETMRDPVPVRSAGLDPVTVERLWEAFLAGAPGLYWSRVWALFALIRWTQRHGVQA